MNIKLKEEPKRDFWIMNDDSQYFVGLKHEGPIWSDNVSDAKIFNEPNKLISLRRWKPQDNPIIVYIDGE